MSDDDRTEMSTRNMARLTVRRLKDNLTEVSVGPVTLLISYGTVVAARVGGLYFETSRFYSMTTSRHISLWLTGHEAAVRSPEWFRWLLAPAPNLLELLGVDLEYVTQNELRQN